MSSSAPRRVRVGNVLFALLGGFVGAVFGGLVAYLVTNDAAVWIAAAVLFVLFEACVLFAVLRRPSVDARRALLWILVLSALVGLASGLFFFMRAALSG
ncbi:MAG: hypothetical protein ACRD1T_00630 [Acidimicrobiia bacterium]